MSEAIRTVTTIEEARALAATLSPLVVEVDAGDALDTVRAVVNALKNPQRRVVVIDNGNVLSPAGTNALQKIAECPPGHVTYIVVRAPDAPPES